MGFEVDSDISVEIAQRGKGMKRLNASNVLGLVTSNTSSSINISGVSLGHANWEVFTSVCKMVDTANHLANGCKYPTEKFEICQLNSIYSDIIA